MSVESDLVITAGGVGPTPDDVTMEGAAPPAGQPTNSAFLRRSLLLMSRWSDCRCTCILDLCLHCTDLGSFKMVTQTVMFYGEQCRG